MFPSKTSKVKAWPLSMRCELVDPIAVFSILLISWQVVLECTALASSGGVKPRDSLMSCKQRQIQPFLYWSDPVPAWDCPGHFFCCDTEEKYLSNQSLSIKSRESGIRVKIWMIREAISDLLSLVPQCKRAKILPKSLLLLTICPHSSKASMANFGHLAPPSDLKQILLAVSGAAECDGNIPQHRGGQRWSSWLSHDSVLLSG